MCDLRSDGSDMRGEIYDVAYLSSTVTSRLSNASSISSGIQANWEMAAASLDSLFQLVW